MSDGVRSHRIGLLLLAALLIAAPVQAQIVTDGSVGPKVSLRGGEIEIGADLGTRKGDNLFHSFEKFGIATDQTATFTGPGAIKNVISRVTGGEISNIDGTLASTVGQADLYFLNPAGVMFGPNAKLDVPGSLHVSTAHELRFADGARFSALDKTGSGLTVAPPEAFGFLDRPAGRIAVDQSQLQLNPGKTFSLVGGDIDVAGGKHTAIKAESGGVHLVTATAGEVRMADGVVTDQPGGAVRLTQRGQPEHAVLDVSGNGGGTIRIRSGQVVVENASVVADNLSKRDGTGGIDLRADAIWIRQGRMMAKAGSTGAAGTVAVTARELELRDGGTMSSGTSGAGDAGRVTVKADRLLVTGLNAAGSPSKIASSAERGSTGAAGTVTVTARELELRDGGVITSDTFGPGSGGQVTVKADRLLVLGANGVITSDTFGRGSGGQVTVEADRLLVSGAGAVITSSAQPGSTGAAGTVAVTARELELRDGGQIFSGTWAHGDAGHITINAQHLLVSGISVISGVAVPGSTGAAGTVAVTARELELRDGGVVSTESLGSGPGGSITLTTANTLRLSNAAIRAQTASTNGGDVTVAVGRLFDLRNSTISTSVASETGSGGNIVIEPPLMVLDGSRIQANAQRGAGGDITIRAGQLISTPDSVIKASSAESVSGTITITAPNTDVAGSLVVLPETFFDASSQLRETCAARGGRPTSSFAPGGRGGLPPDPGAPLAASPFGQPLEQQTATGVPTTLTAGPRQAVKLVTVVGVPQLVLGSPRLTC
jgi:filamentous hemagglutinin family protein